MITDSDNDQGNSAEEPVAEPQGLRAGDEARGKKPDKAGGGGRRPFPWRDLCAWALIVLAFLTAVAAPLASWSHDYMLDTDRFVDAIAPLVKEDAVAQAVSERAAAALVEGLDVQELLEGALPAGIGFIAAPVSSSIQAMAERSAKAILQSDQFYWMWERILRLAHATVVDAVRGSRALEVTQQGEVVLDLGELLQSLRERLVDSGLTFIARVPIPEKAGVWVLFTADELGLARGGIRVLDTLNWILPLLALLFFAAAIAIANDRRKLAMGAGIALALAMAVSLISLRFSRHQLLGGIELEANLLAAQVVWNGLFRSLVQILYGLLALGVIVAAGAAAAGPYGWAVRLRKATTHLFAARRDRRSGGIVEPGPVGGFVEAHKASFRVGGLALAAAILLLLPKVTAGAVIGAAVGLAVYLALIELLRAPGKAESIERGPGEDESGAP